MKERLRDGVQKELRAHPIFPLLIASHPFLCQNPLECGQSDPLKTRDRFVSFSHSSKTEVDRSNGGLKEGSFHIIPPWGNIIIRTQLELERGVNYQGNKMNVLIFAQAPNYWGSS